MFSETPVVSNSFRPIVIAHDIMWTLYGWWLPNDPGGSTSRTTRDNWIAELGELHLGRKRIQPTSHDIRAFYKQATGQLKHFLLSFAPTEFPLAAASIGAAIAEFGLTCYACSVMPDHVHLVIRKHRLSAEDMIEGIQSLSRERLVENGLRDV